jgi:hypothetical protein
MLSIASAAVVAATVQFFATTPAAADRPSDRLPRPAGATAAQLGSRLVLDTLATPAGTSSAGEASPPGGDTAALSALTPPTPAASPAPPTPAVVSSPTPVVSPAAVPASTAPRATAPPATVPTTTEPTLVPVLPVLPQVAPTTGVWAELRQCESGDNYTIDTGNGYYGAYQFSAATWHGLGYPGLPNQASSAVQDQAAAQLQARSGWGQWPECSAKLGL